MTETHYSSPSRRSPLLAPVLLAILAASVAAAWWATGLHKGQSQRGAEIVAEIRDRGLGHFWPDASVHWYVIHRGQDRVGWEARSVTPTGGGNYEGLTARVMIRAAESSTWEQWALSADARRGVYVAGELHLSSQGTVLGESNTTIKLADGTVEANQMIEGNYYQSRAAAPENYLPEGTSVLAMRLVAEQQDEANFRMIVNELAPSGGQPSFPMVTLDYDGPAGDGPFAGAAGVIFEGLGGSHTVYVAEDGSIAGSQVKDRRTVAVSRAELEEAFPKAGALFEAIATQRGVPLPGPAAPRTQPQESQPAVEGNPPQPEERTRVRGPARTAPLVAAMDR